MFRITPPTFPITRFLDENVRYGKTEMGSSGTIGHAIYTAWARFGASPKAYFGRENDIIRPAAAHK